MSPEPPRLAEIQRVAEFRSALRRFQARSDLAARSAGLTPQRYLLLVSIKGSPDGSETATVSDLAERLMMPSTTVSDLVRRAEEVGLLARAQSSRDGRVTNLRLTPEGERRLAACMSALDEDRARLEQPLATASRRIRAMDHAG